MSRGDWYEPKHQIDYSKGKRGRRLTRGRDHTQEEESHNWKMFKWVKGFFHYLNSLFPFLLF